MKISKQTIEILRNYAAINQNILIKEGNVLTTRTVARNLFASATVDTSFPQDVGIYNLSTFLGVLSLFSDPEIDFGESAMTISQGKNKVNYLYAAPAVLDFPDKAIKMPAVTATFELTEENLKSLLKASAVLSSTDLKISSDGKVITCTVLDPKNSAANTFTVEVGESDREFEVFIKIENLKMIPAAYDVSLSEKMIAQFQSKDKSYSLYVANEKNSKWTPE
jgi:hypothetical protein